MPQRNVRLALAVVLSLGAASTRAQSLVYRATPDTLRYESLNSYLLYFVRGSDTLGQPVATRTIESRRFTADGPNLSVWVRLEGTGEFHFRSEQTYTVTPTGRLVLVDGRPAARVSHARVDLLPRLPGAERPLQLGTTWDDSVSVAGSESYGPTSYQVQRRYRVAHLTDSLGTQLALIVAAGQMHIRQGGWQDSATAIVWWQDVAGPVIDSTLFDTRRGQILTSYSTMRLVGTGGVGPANGGATMASGLRSSVRFTGRY